MQNPGNGSADGEVSESLRDLRTEEEKLQRYADAVEWFIDHPEAMRDDPLLERFILWIKEKVDRAAAEDGEGTVPVQAKLACKAV